MNFSYRDLKVWQCSMKLVLGIYATTAQFPRHELYGLVSQMQRAAVSVPSNIAEGRDDSRIAIEHTSTFNQGVRC